MYIYTWNSLCLKTLVIQHPHCAGFLVPPPLHDCTWSWWLLKDGVPGCLFTRVEVRGARAGRCFVPGAEQLLGVIWNMSSQLLQGLEVGGSPELGADAFLPPEAAASSSFNQSWHPRGAVSCDEFGSILLVSSLEISAALFILLMCINNYNSSPHSALPLWVLVTYIDLFFFFSQRKFSTVLLLVTWFVMDIASSTIFSIPTRLHGWILVTYVQFRCVIICLTLVFC